MISPRWTSDMLHGLGGEEQERGASTHVSRVDEISATADPLVEVLERGVFVLGSDVIRKMQNEARNDSLALLG